jgi:hypothetical protein
MQVLGRLGHVVTFDDAQAMIMAVDPDPAAKITLEALKQLLE